MAGRRRRKGLPTQAEMRAARRNASVAARLNQATTPGQRVSVAASHLAAVMQDVSPLEAQRVADTVVADLLATAKELSQQRTNR